MARSILRSLAAVVAGIVAALVGVTAVEVLSAMLHPAPPGVDFATDFEACKAHVARYPAGVLALCGAAWGLVAFASAWVATRLGTSRHLAHGLFVGAVLLAAAIFNMAMLPYPAWFWLNLIVLPAAFVYGAMLGRGKLQVAS
ncbi:hypothetical protein [Planctellipticum variicoloris]|uniref:hypothetical protein n=1 Tax=Planctellipticum variicoloris TaxID=3064265 RepID=UPI003013C5A0|nr:hypothetical protein SH412_001829 [Planctomycetaceae bacterium SH412]